MREIILILSMMALGLFSAKAFGQYIPTGDDELLLQNIQEKVDTMQELTPGKFFSIQTKLPNIISATQNNPRATYILQEIRRYMKATGNKQERSPELLKILSTQL